MKTVKTIARAQVTSLGLGRPAGQTIYLKKLEFLSVNAGRPDHLLKEITISLGKWSGWPPGETIYLKKLQFL